MNNIAIHHNPSCGAPCNMLEMIRDSGTEPTAVLYLETPPSHDELVELITNTGISIQALLHKNVEPYEGLGFAEGKFTDNQLIDFILQHSILINRPIIVTPFGAKPCRLLGAILDIPPDAQKAAFTKEDDEKVVDNTGKRLKQR